jgi:hypothetical protein
MQVGVEGKFVAQLDCKTFSLPSTTVSQSRMFQGEQAVASLRSGLGLKGKKQIHYRRCS